MMDTGKLGKGTDVGSAEGVPPKVGVLPVHVEVEPVVVPVEDAGLVVPGDLPRTHGEAGGRVARHPVARRQAVRHVPCRMCRVRCIGLG